MVIIIKIPNSDFLTLDQEKGQPLLLKVITHMSRCLLTVDIICLFYVVILVSKEMLSIILFHIFICWPWLDDIIFVSNVCIAC